MASNKATKWILLFTHVTVYTSSFFYSVYWQEESYFGGSQSSISDISYWIGKPSSLSGGGISKWPMKIQGWLSIMVDEIFHIILLAIAIYLS
ncbi:hypothetical protein [Peribacillus sp. NPDC097225]|uniref:hypothetical protein n=1 Tax=Peribacillus sp. NPDC097225 TaxID=3364400 RepID=UPI003808A415